MAVIPSVIPNPHCRKAIFYAWDKSAAVRVFGGPTAGVPAKSMTPPGIEGYEPSYDPYPSGADNSGDTAKAKAELQACGKPNGFTTKFFYATPSETGPYLYRVEQKALGRVGIKITTVPGDADPYGCTDGAPALLRRAGVGLLSRSLSVEYPTGSAFYHYVDPRVTCLEDQHTNLRRLHNPTIDRILYAAARGRATDADWRALDGAVMASATYLPLTWEKTLYYRGPRLTNVTCDNALASGIYDFVNVGVSR
jgi:peptide/nickel transport system substrate-binding protein